MALGIDVGSEANAPLARAVIGGLAVSTVLTLVLIPTLYVMLEERFPRRVEAPEGEPVAAGRHGMIRLHSPPFSGPGADPGDRARRPRPRPRRPPPAPPRHADAAPPDSRRRRRCRRASRCPPRRASARSPPPELVGRELASRRRSPSGWRTADDRGAASATTWRPSSAWTRPWRPCCPSSPAWTAATDRAPVQVTLGDSGDRQHRRLRVHRERHRAPSSSSTSAGPGRPRTRRKSSAESRSRRCSRRRSSTSPSS